MVIELCKAGMLVAGKPLQTFQELPTAFKWKENCVGVLRGKSVMTCPEGEENTFSHYL